MMQVDEDFTEATVDAELFHDWCVPCLPCICIWSLSCPNNGPACVRALHACLCACNCLFLPRASTSSS